jgi:hypothetical protein
VKFICFGISYHNPCSPLSLSVLPAPRSTLQAHVLATSEEVLRLKQIRAAEVALAKSRRAAEREENLYMKAQRLVEVAVAKVARVGMRASQASQRSLGATPTEIGQGNQADAALFGIQCATPLLQGHSSSAAADFNFSPTAQQVPPQFFFRTPSSFVPVSPQQQFQFHQFGTPILSTGLSRRRTDRHVRLSVRHVR